jgi:L-ascorbate metabolism protein UlaG (beta-lactamase superfamily)
MEIVWHGHACFRLRNRDVTVMTDPYQKEIGYNLGRPTAEIVTISHDHPGHNNASAIGGNPRVLTGPGEYEVKGVPIIGVQTAHDADNGKQRGKNTVFLIELDEVIVCHLGDLGHIPSTKQLEAMNNVDVLLVPVGGLHSLTAAEAAEVISLVEPKLIIPMHYRTDQLRTGQELDPVDVFARETGSLGLEPQTRVTVTRSSLPSEPQIVLLEARRG